MLVLFLCYVLFGVSIYILVNTLLSLAYMDLLSCSELVVCIFFWPGVIGGFLNALNYSRD